jgi:hypothetical protein
MIRQWGSGSGVERKVTADIGRIVNMEYLGVSITVEYVSLFLEPVIILEPDLIHCSLAHVEYSGM